MPRDSSGNYTLPGGNPVVTGTVITSTWANPTMADLAAEIENSLSRDGQGGMRSPLLFADGSIGAPSITFNTEPTLGIYRKASNIFGITGMGSDIALFNASNGNMTVTGQSKVVAAAPAAVDDLTRKDYVDGKTAGALADGNYDVAPDDLDTILVNSTYVTSLAATNGPADFTVADQGFIETLMHDTNGNGVQILVGINGANEGRQWQRSFAAAVWGAWHRVTGQQPVTTHIIEADDPAWVPTPGVRAMKVIVTGSGGGGGAADGGGSAGTQARAGSGGGTSVRWLFPPFEDDYAIVVGAGGAGGVTPSGDGGAGAASTFIGGGVNMQGDGGLGGGGAASGTSQIREGHVGGGASGGDRNVPGGDSGSGAVTNGRATFSCHSGGSYWGHGRHCRDASNGFDGNAWGVGGGTTGIINNASNFSGGEGAGGVCVIEEHF